MKILEIIPLRKGIFKDNLTYFTSLDVSIGDIVNVPIRSKNTLGLVSSVEELTTEKSNVKNMNFNLRKVSDTKGISIFRKEFLEACFDTGKYFVKNKNMSISSLIPKIFIEEYDKISKVEKNTKEPVLENNLKSEKLLFQYPREERISIYKTLIRESFAKGQSIFIVMPTENDIEKFEEILGKGIEQFTFTLHSNVNKKKLLQNYEKIINTDHGVLMIGTAPFLSIPKLNLNTIILEQENSNAYRMMAPPYFDLRSFVEIFASKINAKLILADDLLRFETIERKELHGLNTLYPMSFRTESNVDIELLGKEPIQTEKIKFKVLKDKSLEEITKTLANKKNVFIYALRKGLSTMTLCKDCGNTVVCKTCNSTLTIYTSKDGKKKMFVCNKCGEQKDTNTMCDICGSWNLIPLGIGTDTVYEYIKINFPKVKIYKIDKESVKNKTQANKIIKEFEDNNGAILIGTEMAFSYLKQKTFLSIIASFDSLWSIPSFKMGERILKILLTIKNMTEKKFIIQAKNEKDGAILAIIEGNFLSFIRSELEDRKTLNYPPYKRFIKVVFYGEKNDTLKAKEYLKEKFQEYNPEIFSGFVHKIKGKYSTNMLIKIEPNKWSLPTIALNSSIDPDLYHKLSSLEPTFRVFVDPEDLL